MPGPPGPPWPPFGGGPGGISSPPGSVRWRSRRSSAGKSRPATRSTGPTRPTRIDLRVSRINSARIAMPDIERRIRNRRASFCIHHGDAHAQRHSDFSFRDVAPQKLAIDVVRPFFLLGIENASRRGSSRSAQSHALRSQRQSSCRSSTAANKFSTRPFSWVRHSHLLERPVRRCLIFRPA